MIISNRSYIFLIVALSVASWSLPTWAGLTQDLEPGTIAPGTRTTLTITLDYKDLEGVNLSDESAVPELVDEPFGKADGLLLLDRNYERTKDRFIWKYVFTGYLPSTYRIPAVEIRFGAQTFSTTAQALTITTTRADGDEEIRPEIDEEELKGEWVLWPWLFFLIPLLVAAGFWLRKKLGKKETEAPASANFEAPEAWLKAALAELAENQSKLTHTEAIEKFEFILRSYLEMRYLSPTQAMTLREILSSVRKWEGADGDAELEKLLLSIEHTLFSRAESNLPPGTGLVTSAIQTTESKWLKKEEPTL